MGRYTKNELLNAEDAKRDFLREVDSKRAWYDLKTNELLGDAMGLTKSTMRMRLLNPDSLTIGELRSMIKVLHLDIWTVIRFVGFQIKEINKARKERGGNSMHENEGMTYNVKFVDYETNILQSAKDSGNPVRLIFTNGYQTEAVIEDFNIEVIVARVRDERWLVYKFNLSTIAF